jgi:hypothetical protein
VKCTSSWHLWTCKMYQSFHRYKVYKMKSAHFTKTMQKRTYARSAYRKTCRGVANCWFFPSWPKDSKTNHLNLSELVCLNSEDDWTNPQDNSIKILWPIQTQQGNQYRQNYVTVTYVLWEQMNRRTVDLGFIQSRAEVTAVFANVDSTHGLRQFRQRFGNKKKDKRKG